MKRSDHRRTVHQGVKRGIAGLLGTASLLWVFSVMTISPRPLRADGAVRTALISETEAAAAGLTRPWFNQVTMDPSHDKVTQITLQDDTLFITTDNGRIHVIDTVTGNTLWSRPVGPATYYSLPPAANSFVVVVLHGTTLHVFDRFEGKKLLEIPVNGPPGGGPQVSEHYIYVPILTGKIFAYPLRRYQSEKDAIDMALKQNDGKLSKAERAQKIRDAIEKIAKDKKIEKRGIWPIQDGDIQTCPALGQPLVQPFLCSQTGNEDYFSWVTTHGWLMIGNLNLAKEHNALQLLYRVSLSSQTMFIDRHHYKGVDLEFANDINSRPTYIQKDVTEVNSARGDEADGGLILMGAGSGYVFAVNDTAGTVQWTFPVGMSVIDPIGVADNHCFIPTFVGRFFCLDIKNGKEIWNIRDIKQFVSATKNRLYALDMLGNILVINRDNGQILHSIPLTTGMRGVFNVESDRIYLIGNDGLVQCLHESQLDKPLHYRETSMDIAKKFQDRLDSVDQNANELKNEDEEKPAPAVTPEEDPAVHDDIFGTDEEIESEEEENRDVQDDSIEDADEEANPFE